MTNIQDKEGFFRERKTVEDIFLEYKPFSLRQTLISINAISEEEEKKDELDDEILAIDLKNKNVKNDIRVEIESSLDNS